jgi:hypothetical protein
MEVGHQRRALHHFEFPQLPPVILAAAADRPARFAKLAFRPSFSIRKGTYGCSTF